MVKFLHKRKRLLIIGLDGVPYHLIKTFAEKGIMPCCREIFQKGKLSRMEVSIPEISSVSWSGFMTGTDSGNHGIFGFVDLVEGSYRYKFPDFRDLQATPFFVDLGRRGKRSVIINLPATYPAPEVRGVLISGFVALQLRKAVFPLSYLNILEEMDYQVDSDTAKGRGKQAEFLSDLHYTLSKRREIAEILWRREKWDLFMLTVTGTDRLHHFFYDAAQQPDHPHHEAFLQYYQAVDRMIGDFYERIRGQEEIDLLMLSDHGFTTIEQEIYLNPILKKNGFFSLNTSSPQSLESMSEHTRAFAVDPSRIFINLKGRYPGGTVDRASYQSLRNDLKQLFLELKVNGREVIKKVFFREDIYSSRFLSRAADIVLLSNPGFDLKGGLKKKQTNARSHFTGMHTQDDAFFFSAGPELNVNNINIFMVKDIIYRCLGMRVSSDG